MSDMNRFRPIRPRTKVMKTTNRLIQSDRDRTCFSRTYDIVLSWFQTDADVPP